jgi:hypothetical protein
LLFAIVVANGCTPPGSMAQTAVSSDRTGRVEIRVTDAPRQDNITEIWIGVGSVEIHRAGVDSEESDGWISANITGPNPFELLALKNGGIQEILGDADLTVGKYTQIRLNVDNVTVRMNGENRTAEVPSGKIKFVHPFEVAEGKTTVLLFDFDAAKSVRVTGNSGKVIVKPVIKLTSGKPAPADIPLKIITAHLPGGNVGVSYNVTLEAKGGLAPYEWSVLSGSLPGGITLDADTGVISGEPGTSDNYTFTIRVTDSSTEPKVASREYTIKIAP